MQLHAWRIKPVSNKEGVCPSSVRTGIVAKNLPANHPGISCDTSLIRQGLVTLVTPANPVAVAYYKWNIKFFLQGALRMTENTG